MQDVKAQLSQDEANRLQHSMRIFSSPTTAGMSRCRLHAVLHTVAGKQDQEAGAALQLKKRKEKRGKRKQKKRLRLSASI